ncbi:LacI family DNA-binding transcriptional regulator [Streptomyces sp. GC420]|uniref:LacI family DNA-binding transcriptional regulator n=1 Tax=Streptomyces sp. GC420 TaxID=2697568 RepID=UPI0014150CCF|nr:LacI family DNA-binding transcriptional regulator [Streptomyces sp. GC420]NBM14500.1 substrate-binding domain-containing protein [Streptomyces sp. GC420]
MTVSITDVAKAAGVSASTVSRALRGRSGVSDEVRARITEVAASLGYTASRNASGLASRRTFTVGVLTPFVGRWFFGQVIDSVEKVLSASGYDLLLYNVGSDEARDRFFTAMPARKRVDALLSLLVLTDDEAAALRSMEVPLAAVVGGPRPGFATVGIDDRAGARLAVRHLINLGHRRIGLIGTGPTAPMHWTTPIERRRAYLETLAEAGLAFDPELEADGDYTVAGGERAMTQLLTAVHPPTAVFAQSDEMAMGALRALRHHGLRVPEDMCLVGFDDHELAEVAGLTTVAQPVAEQGTAAARILLDQMQNPGAEAPEFVELPVRLVARDTTGPLRAPSAR